MNPGDIQRRSSRLRGQADWMALKPYGAQIVATNPQADEITYVAPRGGSNLAITHPYLGPNSWIRVAPERGTKILLGTRGENGEPLIVGYFREGGSSTLIGATEDNRFYYRPLREGEIDIASPGIAYAQWSRRGNLELKGGIVSVTLQADKLDLTSKAPTHIRKALGYKRLEVNNEERFGVVKRPNPDDVTQDRIVKITPTGGQEVFAVEYLRNLQSKTIPAVLVDHREGHVIDDDGQQMTADSTGVKLRARTEYGTKADSQVVLEVDEEGNIGIIIPASATKGIKIDVDETDLTANLGRDLLLTLVRNAVIDAQKIVFKAENVYVGSNEGTEPLVLGRKLSNWIIAHTHPSGTGPTGVPIQAGTFEEVLSTQHKIDR